MAFSQFNKSTASSFASSRQHLLFNPQRCDSPLSQPIMTKNAGATPLIKNRAPMLGSFAKSSASNAALNNSSSSCCAPSNAMIQSDSEQGGEIEYKPDTSLFGYFNRTIQENVSRSRFNSQQNKSRSRSNS